MYIRHKNQPDWGLGILVSRGESTEVRFPLVDPKAKRFRDFDRYLEVVTFEEEAVAARQDPKRAESWMAAIRSKKFEVRWEIIRPLLWLLDPTGQREKELILSGYVPVKQAFTFSELPLELYGPHPANLSCTVYT